MSTPPTDVVASSAAAGDRLPHEPDAERAVIGAILLDPSGTAEMTVLVTDSTFDDIARQAMAFTGVTHLADRRIDNISGGERQRVVFARALAQNTPVLILDEATSNLDINYAISLLNLSEKRVHEQGATVISVMQDINLAAVYCDDLLFMTEGRIAVHGATKDVLNSETIRRIFNIDSKVYAESYSDSLQVVFKK